MKPPNIYYCPEKVFSNPKDCKPVSFIDVGFIVLCMCSLNLLQGCCSTGKTGNFRVFIFPDGENTGNLPKMILHGEFTSNTGKSFN